MVISEGLSMTLTIRLVIDSKIPTESKISSGEGKVRLARTYVSREGDMSW